MNKTEHIDKANEIVQNVLGEASRKKIKRERQLQETIDKLENEEEFKEYFNYYSSWFGEEKDDCSLSVSLTVIDNDIFDGFYIYKGQSYEQEEKQYIIKLLAIAGALESMPHTESEKKGYIDCYRSLARDILLKRVAKEQEKAYPKAEQARTKMKDFIERTGR